KKARGWAGVSKVDDAPQNKPVQQSPKPEAQPMQPEKNKQPQTADSAAKSSLPAIAPLIQAQAEPSGLPVFKVQIMASDRQIREGNKLLKGLTGVDCYREHGMWKYTVGASTDYNEIYRLRKEVIQKFPQAFIIAFKNGERVDVQAAIQEFKKNKRN
ncbi:MAG: N-acetylmuramoyl-L-alanine amidase, partial [Prevotella sp.]|nr:N-acetylmuramoyl-L-alanine amidase [Prevotella sp.]